MAKYTITFAFHAGRAIRSTNTLLGAGDYNTLPPVADRHLLLPNNSGIAPDASLLSVSASWKDSSSLQSIEILSHRRMPADFIRNVVDKLDAESIDFYLVTQAS